MASAVSAPGHGSWSAEDTTPAAIESALSALVAEGHADEGRYAPARVLNLVVVCDADRRGEVLERLERVGRFHPSRTVICALRWGRSGLGAFVTMACEMPSEPGGLALCRERVEIELDPAGVDALSSVVDPLLVPDLATLAWAPHGHPEVLDALAALVDVVLLDSNDAGPDAVDSGAGTPGGLARALELSERAYVVDLSWLRGAPWRERLAALLDPPEWRPAIADLTTVEVRHHPGSVASAALYAGWLAERLGWEVEPLEADEDGARRGEARSPAGAVAVALRGDPTMPVPGLAGVSIAAHSGLALDLDRGPGGLAVHRRTPDGGEGHWTALGASRGEAGVLGEGIRQALLRSTLYRPALERAARMVL